MTQRQDNNRVPEPNNQYTPNIRDVPIHDYGIRAPQAVDNRPPPPPPTKRT